MSELMRGVIAAGNPQTAAAGAEMLRQGGNAVDAAVAAAFASFLAEIGVVHLGGSGLAQIYDPAARQSTVYDFFSAMPGLGRPGMPSELDFEAVTIDYGATTQIFHLGRGSVGVPGNIFGLCQLAADYGRLPLATLLEPAISLARDGAFLDQFQADTCELLSPLYTHTPEMRAVFAPGDEMLRAGERVTIPGLVETLSALAQEGEELARTGRLAQSLLMDQKEQGGLLTAEDLAAYRVELHSPIRVTYRDCQILLPPPPSSGGVLTAFALRLLAHFPVALLPWNGADHLRLLYEVMAATTRARPVWEELVATAEPGAAVSAFLDDDFLAPHVAAVHTAWRRDIFSSPLAEAPGPANTSHLSIIDGNGMAVSLTTTAGESAGYIVPGTGMIPNNILGEEDLNPQGYHRWPAGRRIPTMMTPAIVLCDGNIRLVTGSGGSNRIRSAILQTLSNVLDFNLPLEEAVNAPRVHLDGQVLQCEAGYDAAAVTHLEASGYPVNRWMTRSIYFGGAHSVAASGAGLTAAGDDRRGGATAHIG
ncbi:MAG: gamma-glutamyltransferase [Anaerolineae bacterium]|nr:gamma-glutamyltransferase [Anaerolineae bacterium]